METIESYWSKELGEPVEIREIEGWGEFDIYIDGSFAVTTAKLEQAEAWLERYWHLQKAGAVA